MDATKLGLSDPADTGPEQRRVQGVTVDAEENEPGDELGRVIGCACRAVSLDREDDIFGHGEAEPDEAAVDDAIAHAGELGPGQENEDDQRHTFDRLLHVWGDERGAQPPEELIDVEELVSETAGVDQPGRLVELGHDELSEEAVEDDGDPGRRQRSPEKGY